MAKGSRLTPPTAPGWRQWSLTGRGAQKQLIPVKRFGQRIFFARRPPKMKMSIGTLRTPNRGNYRHRLAGAVNLALGWAPVRSLKDPNLCPSSRLHVGAAHAPTTHRHRRLGAVGEWCSLSGYPWPTGWSYDVPGRLQRSLPGVNSVEPAVGSDFHPGDVVTQALGLPAGDGRVDHGKVGFAAG